MSGTFRNTAFNRSLTPRSDGTWDVSNVTDMNYMFYRATQFDQDLSGWDVRKVTSRLLFDSGATAWREDYKPAFG